MFDTPAVEFFMTSVSVRIAGANGEGIESSGALLIEAAAKNGLHVFGYRGYQSIVGGGHVWYQVRIGDAELHSHGNGIDILVALNQDAILHQKNNLNRNATVIYDPSKIDVSALDASNFKLVKLPMLDIAMEVSGTPIIRNVVAIGAVLKLIGADIAEFDKILRAKFGRKGDKVVNDNIQAATQGYGYAGVEKTYTLSGDGKRRYFLDGNTALSLGAYAAGCKFYAAYPMTPASGVMTWFAAHENKGVFFKQTEDEISAINVAIGASVAGVRSMCGTSGGGFSLMVEGLGLAGMIEAPIVVIDSQRTGPSTGLPTKNEQGDLLFAMHASQGEFPRIVVAPSSVEESFKIGAEVFDLAERYQVPVIILMDQYLSECVASVEHFDLDSATIDRGKVVKENGGPDKFKRYELTEDGISPRAFPGTKGCEHVAPSDEHNEYGELVSDAFAGLEESIKMRKLMHEKRMRKIETMLKKEKIFVPKIINDGADYFFVTFGSTTGPVLEAAEILKNMGRKFGIVLFNYIMPLDKERTKTLLNGKKLINVEGNFTGQLAQVIKLATGTDMMGSILKYDGEAFSGEEIAKSALALTK